MRNLEALNPEGERVSANIEARADLGDSAMVASEQFFVRAQQAGPGARDAGRGGRRHTRE